VFLECFSVLVNRAGAVPPGGLVIAVHHNEGTVAILDDSATEGVRDVPLGADTMLSVGG
jgi:hypothetical protein